MQPQIKSLKPPTEIKNKSRERGAAILLALLITAMVAGIAVVLRYHARLDIEQITLSNNHQKMQQAAELGKNWAQAILLKRYQASKKPPLDPSIFINFPQLDITLPSNLQVQAKLNNAQGRLNLNQFVGKSGQTNLYRFTQLLQALGINNSGEITRALYEFINPQPGILHLMATPSVLLTLDGLSRADYRKLAPYLIALPNPQAPLFEQAASVQVLLTRTKRSATQIQNALACLGREDPLANFKKCHLSPVSKSSTLPHFFLLTTQINLDKQTLTQKSLLYLNLPKTSAPSAANSLPSVQILWQSQGGLP